MPKNFKPLAFEKRNVGKHIKATKKRYLWRLELDNKEYEITLYISKLSGKRKILLNGDIYSEQKRSSTSYGSYPIRVGAHNLLVFEVDDNKFDLRVDNLSFEASFNSQKMSSGFMFEEGPGESPGYGGYLEDPFKPQKKPVRQTSPDIKKTYSPEPIGRVTQSRTVFKPPEREEVKVKVEPKPVVPAKPKAPEPTPLDLFDMPNKPINTALPDDLFAMPLSSSERPAPGNEFNPFEEPKQVKPVIEQSAPSNRSPNLDLFDLDNLHLGDNYSPAIAKKIQEANKPISIGENTPNVPMHQLQSSNPNMVTGQMNPMNQMNPMMMNPMAMNPMMMNPMMAYNPFMTGMMPNPWMQNPK